MPALADFAALLLVVGREAEAGELLARLEAVPPDGPELAARLRLRVASGKRLPPAHAVSSTWSKP